MRYERKWDDPDLVGIGLDIVGPMRAISHLLGLVLCSVSLVSFAGDEIKCNDVGTQLELNACARDAFNEADDELNRTYQALIKKEANDKTFTDKLRFAQKAWIAFRDADLEARFACAEGNMRVCWGSMYPMSFLYRKTELTRERTKHLRQLLTDGRGE